MKIAELIMTCTSHPLQFSGTLMDGRPVYFRARNSGWYACIADEYDGDPVAVRFGREPGWYVQGVDDECAAHDPEFGHGFMSEGRGIAILADALEQFPSGWERSGDE